MYSIQMKKILFIPGLLIVICNTAAWSQLITYPWPEGSELIDDRNYSIRAREVDTASGSNGSWIVLKSFYSFQRSYPDHWKCGSDAGTDFMADRSLTFASFAFRGVIEVEVTQNLSSARAVSVELAPKAFGFNPIYFDGTTVRFVMDRPEYVSVNFGFGESDMTINRDDNRAGGADIRHGCMILAEVPEEDVDDYEIPSAEDPGIVVWSNDTDLAVIRSADIIYFPPGEHDMRDHKDRWERNSSWEKSEAEGNWVTTENEYRIAALYRGRLNLGKDNQKVYLASGAIVYGGFHSAGKDGNWLYGRGIVTGRRHLMHEIVVPATGTIAETEPYELVTRTKEAFCHFGQDAVYDGIIFLEAWHHTCPSASGTRIERIKIIGWCSNNDGIRPGDGSRVERIFIKTSDDYDYYRSPHTMQRAVVWPMVNGAVGQLGWNNLGTGYAEFRDIYVINPEWHVASIAEKSNIGIICGGKADAGIKLQKNVLENCHIEHRTNFLVAVALEGSGTGYLKDFTIRNVTTEYPFQNPAEVPVKQELRGAGNTWCENWTFSNVFIDGVLLTWENHRDYFNLELEGMNGLNSDESAKTRNVAFNWAGTIHTITTTSTGNGSLRPRGNGGVIQMGEGMDQTVTIDPGDSNRIRSITVDGILRYEYGNPELNDRRKAWLFGDVHSDHTIHVDFEPGKDYFDLDHSMTASGEKTCEEITLFPVPAGKMVTVRNPGGSPALLRLIGPCGSAVMEKNVTGDHILLPLNDVGKGYYMLEISRKGESAFHPLIVL